jgi:hypothetical protein
MKTWLLIPLLLGLSLGAPSHAKDYRPPVAAPGYPPAETRPEPVYSPDARSVAAAVEKQGPLLEAGEKHLYGLQPRLAIQTYRRCLEEGRALPPSDDANGMVAAWGIARAYAEQGDFKRALAWLDFADGRAIMCGTGAHLLEVEESARHTVWRAASDPTTAGRQLRRLVAAVSKAGSPRAWALIGNPGLLEKLLWRSPETAMRGLVAREARLLLGELLVRRGRAREAAALLRAVAANKSVHGDDPLSVLARAHLRRVGK